MAGTLERTTLRGLMEALRNNLPDAYPGGSNGSDLKRFESYVRRKGFSFQLYTRTDNARMAENKLLRLCNQYGCHYNVQRRSSLKPNPGFVYVLL